MITESTIYWVTRFDAIKDFFVFIIALLASSAVVCFLSAFAYCNYHDSSEEDYEASIRYRIRGGLYCIYALVLCAFLDSFVPTTKEMLIIKGVVTEDTIQIYEQLAVYIEEKIGDK